MTTHALRLVVPALLSLWFLMAPPAALAQVCSETRDEIRQVAAWYGTGKLSDNSATVDALELSDHITNDLAWLINLLQTDPRVTDNIGDWVDSSLETPLLPNYG